MLFKTSENLKNEITKYVGVEVLILDFKKASENKSEFSIYSTIEDSRFYICVDENDWNVRYVYESMLIEDVHLRGFKEVLDFIKGRISIEVFKLLVKNSYYVVKHDEYEYYFDTLDECKSLIEEKCLC